jgi:hypothetical protein
MSSLSEELVLLICDAESSGWTSVAGECDGNMMFASCGVGMVDGANASRFILSHSSERKRTKNHEAATAATMTDKRYKFRTINVADNLKLFHSL